ncbi:MAG: BtrH N-terminal domain-containing protein [Candidatus Helarchaeota archaeon]
MTNKRTSKRTGVQYVIENDIFMIDNFKHMSGKNCQLSSLQKVLNHYGIEISENLLLGIASGLGFIYWDMKLMPVPFVGGLNGKNITIFENILNRLGGSLKLLKTGSLRVSYNTLKDFLKQNIPIIVFVDMAYLPYFFRENAPYPMEEAHFGGHTIVIYGLNENEKILYVSDRFNKPSKLSIQNFMDAHSSKHAPFAANNRKLDITIPKTTPDLKPIIINAIKENVEIMINPPIRNLGLKGMLKFKEMVGTWTDKFDDEKLLFALVNTWIYNQTGGTGGALFRNMYHDFLIESYEIIDNKILSEAADIFSQAAQAWDNVALYLLPDELPSLKEIRDIYTKTNKAQESQEPNYRSILAQLDDQWKSIKDNAINEVKQFPKYLPRLQDSIQNAYDLEVKGFNILAKL